MLLRVEKEREKEEEDGEEEGEFLKKKWTGEEVGGTLLCGGDRCETAA